jgi:hypothetical protein
MMRSLSIGVSTVRRSKGTSLVRYAGSQSNETYTEKQSKKGRPVSPHVTIYKFPVVALSSITNRVTGVILTGGTSIFLSCCV